MHNATSTIEYSYYSTGGKRRSTHSGLTFAKQKKNEQKEGS